MVDFAGGVNFVTHSGIHVVEHGPDRVVGRIEVEPHHHQPFGVVHGGVHCTLVETLASIGGTIWATERGMAGCVGVHNATDFLRAIRDGVLVGVATPIHQGRSQQLWAVEVTRESDGELVALGQLRLHNLTSDSSIAPKA